MLEEETPRPVFGHAPLSARPIVVGSGPCGLFCAVLLAENGYAPLLLERGADVNERVKAVETFYRTGVLLPETNIQFGAGGAGTFSDGKLLTRINDPLCRYVLTAFVNAGAPRDILTLAKPHIGTDVLRNVVGNLIARIRALGGDVRFGVRVDGILRNASGVCGVRTNEGDIPCGALTLATGHSARDTYRMLLKEGFALTPKPFSVGMRIEHLQRDIDEALYGSYAGHPLLGCAEYALSYNTKERGVYTFCMCPGGEVIAAAGEESGVVVNGMSFRARNGQNANSAVVCSVFREDYGNTPEGAIAFQQKIERDAFAAGGGAYHAPLITVGDFLSGGCSVMPKRVLPTYMGGEKFRLARPETYLPGFVCEKISEALADFGKKIKGFDAEDAILTGAETRTSSPLRFERTGEFTAPGYNNLFPAGEGAGYAGGITSAAVDGLRAALALMKTFRPFE